MRSSISGLIDQVRNEIFDLRNNSRQSFSEAIKSQLETLLSGNNISYRLQGESEINQDHQYQLIRCIRELILNSISHSNCKNVEITLSSELIIYSDDGAFEESNNQTRFGLVGMSERLAAIGGQLNREASKFTIQLPTK